MARTKKVIYPLAMTELDYAGLGLLAASWGTSKAEAMRRAIREAAHQVIQDVSPTDLSQVN